MDDEHQRFEDEDNEVLRRRPPPAHLDDRSEELYDLDDELEELMRQSPDPWDWTNEPRSPRGFDLTDPPFEDRRFLEPVRRPKPKAERRVHPPRSKGWPPGETRPPRRRRWDE